MRTLLFCVIAFLSPALCVCQDESTTWEAFRPATGYVNQDKLGWEVGQTYRVACVDAKILLRSGDTAIVRFEFWPDDQPAAEWRQIVLIDPNDIALKDYAKDDSIRVHSLLLEYQEVSKTYGHRQFKIVSVIDPNEWLYELVNPSWLTVRKSNEFKEGEFGCVDWEQIYKESNFWTKDIKGMLMVWAPDDELTPKSVVLAVSDFHPDPDGAFETPPDAKGLGNYVYVYQGMKNFGGPIKDKQYQLFELVTTKEVVKTALDKKRKLEAEEQRKQQLLDRPFRMWNSLDGFSVSARFVSSSRTTATLVREDNGKTITVAIDRLVAADQEYITQIKKRK